ncbi:MAG TPA: SpoIIE family protein phosphatase [Vicinamibacterales bacterium]|nr:SpoIIE family protein phosphatase [Vicinamibacterales bacterium]
MESHSRYDAVRAWLTRTFAGRLLIAGVALKLVAWTGALTGWRPGLFNTLDTVGGLAILVSALVIGYRVYAIARHRLLWRVRRKLILSYIFIGVVPVILVAIFFTVGGLLFFFNVSAFMLRNHVTSVVEGAQFLAQAAAPALASGTAVTQLTPALTTRQTAASVRYPLVSYALVPTDRSCNGEPGDPAPKAAAGPWRHMEAPRSIPSWVPCTGFSSLIAYQAEGGTRIAARAVAWPPGLRSALVVDIPFGDALIREFHDEMGITIEAYTIVEMFADTSDGTPPARSQGRMLPGPVNIRFGDENEPLGWVAFLDYTDWKTGEMSGVTVGFRMGLAAVYRYLSGPSFERLDNFNLGQILLLLLGIVGGLFLIIQAVALVMGLTLARSITGSVHELFGGTERVQRGDFSHKIAIRSRDQLGELAGSFNSMTASIEGLLREKAEKERLEQELLIARNIQMSLLPQGPLEMPGVSLSGHCEPAREVGGDYYDFLPLDDDRLGILIADVSGKGTSAALYMAELKGLVLSLSLQYVSPRRMLIEANRIISKHLDSRSFITMTYAVVDMRARTMTCARAGHCPLIYVPGPDAASRTPQVLTPEGMVVGLQFDVGDAFERLLEEVTIPLGRGDLFVLYTDGISEAMNPEGDCFGDHRLVELAHRHADLASDDLQKRILSEVHTFAGDAAQHDDMTMVLVKIH